MKQDNILFLDVETTIFNKGHPFDPRNFLVSYAYCNSNSSVNFCYSNEPDFLSQIRSLVEKASCICGFNVKFDLHWLANHGIYVPVNTRVWDCQLAEFILSGQTLPYDSLNAACERYGLPVKKDVVAEYWAAGISTENIPRYILEEYNNWDVYLTRELYKIQQQLCTDKQKRLIELEGEDLKALMAAERAGIKFDVSSAVTKCDDLGTELLEIDRQLTEYLPKDIPDPPGFNCDSGDQLSCLLYGGEVTYDYVSEVLKYKSGAKAGEPYNKWASRTIRFPGFFKPLPNSEVKKTAKDPTATTHLYQTDFPTLTQLRTANKMAGALRTLLFARSEKTKVKEMLESIQNTMIKKNWQDNYIHPQFNQNVVITGRLSSSQPNMQNTPPEVDEFLVSRYND